jgi:hypothetical protein
MIFVSSKGMMTSTTAGQPQALCLPVLVIGSEHNFKNYLTA